MMGGSLIISRSRNGGADLTRYCLIRSLKSYAEKEETSALWKTPISYPMRCSLPNQFRRQKSLFARKRRDEIGLNV